MASSINGLRLPELLPRVHLMASLLKRWLPGTHQGAVSREHQDYYLDESTFGFNRRNSRSRGQLFLRLAEHAVAGAPAPYNRREISFRLSQLSNSLSTAAMTSSSFAK